MEKLVSIMWIVLVVIPATLSQYYLIDKKKIYPNKVAWFLIRVVVAGVFFGFYIWQDFYYLQALFFMAFSFWWPFNTGLNLLRGRFFSNLAPKNDPIDWLLIKITNGDVKAESNSGKNIMQELMISLLGFLAFVFVMYNMFWL